MNKRSKSYILIGVLCFFFILFIGWNLKSDTGFFAKYSSGEKQPTHNVVTKSELETNIDQEIKTSHFQGTALLVSQGNIFFQQGYGYADAEKKLVNKTESVYPIASLQKIITGAIILELVQAGELKMDTTLASFYPELKYSQTITIRDMLNHTSGILMPEEEPATLLKTQKSQIDNALKSLAVMPDKEFMYTNGNYTLLAGIISKISGQEYEDVVQKRVIEKLSLKHTYFWDNLPKNETKVQPYFYEGQDYQTDSFSANEKLFSSLLGAGNMYMSTADFLTFIQSLANGQLFDQKQYEQLADAKREGYQAGIFYFDGLKYSEGNLGAYNTVVYGDLANQNLVILFANQAPVNGMSELSRGLYNQLLNK
ncbi:serine hydrolase domain-containing protein [Enterococcus quebecensis]|uniref:Serine hydrolase n=1 Tax=Enterococcus quebecensis TaxID=903983 RepID=A0A1E5H2J5_9ENTE|nr:serine hydrolase domain-containing protein [Enterococcus quebecensis]OEG18850.1 serine hydrolase [Enterococcus quebecensis]OJG71839.1 hypothetical protein RV12_GL001481 [Enterococcus quebecensis]